MHLWDIYLFKAYVRLEIGRKLLQKVRVGVQGVKSLGGYFACLCQRFWFLWIKNVIFWKGKGSTFTLLIIFIVKSLPKK